MSLTYSPESHPREQKPWGTTQPLYVAGRSSAHRIEVVPGGFCSIHHHRFRDNLFSIEWGSLLVYVAIGETNDRLNRYYRANNFADEIPLPWGKGAGEYAFERFTLNAGESPLRVAAGDWHIFRAIGDVVATEIYFARGVIDIDMNDIFRVTTGGRIRQATGELT